MVAVHGGLDTAELRRLGLRPEQVLDFSSNINPLGTSSRVRQAAANTDLSAYPDRNCLVLREALSARLGVSVDNILVGNGTVQLIHLLARSGLHAGQTCLIFAPTFGEYAEAAATTEAGVRYLLAEETHKFRWSIDAAVHAIERIRPQLVFLCNPNNPTGVGLDRSEVQRIINAVGCNGLLVLDDSYSAMSDSRWDALVLLESGDVVILRSMTKDHALAGVRLGYMVAGPDVIRAARRLQPVWSVNAVAQAAGVVALDDDAHVAAARKVIKQSKKYLYAELGTLGLQFLPSPANFLIVHVRNATKVRNALLQKGIAVRDCTSFGLPNYIRIAVRRLEECQRLIQSLKEVLKS